MKMSQSKRPLNSYTLTLKIQPYSALWAETGERVSFMNKFSTWIDRFHTPLVELTNCSLLMDSKFVESKNKSTFKKLYAQNFVGAIITFKAQDEDIVCEWMDELPTSSKYSWNFEILKSCELLTLKGF